MSARDIIRIIVAALCVAVMVAMLQGCKVCEPCVPETIVRDSIRTEHRLDSIFLYQRDSIYIHEKADTVYVNKYITRYKDVLKVERDTVWRDNHTVEVQQVRYIPKFYKWMTWIGVALVVLLLVWLVLKVRNYLIGIGG